VAGLEQFLQYQPSWLQ